jgi:hypothetical protein
MPIRDSERLTEPPGTGAQRPDLRSASPGLHNFNAMGRGQRPYQNRPARLRSADQIETPVHAIGAIDIDVADGSEHGAIAQRQPSETVGGGIAGLIGLRLHDHAADAAELKGRANQGAGRLWGRGAEQVFKKPHR